MKKGLFYVQNDIFKMQITPKASVVYFYLCKCANKAGQCFPSKTDISNNCNLGKTSVGTALDELKNNGIIEIEYQYRATNKGHKRQTSNLYTLLDFDCTDNQNMNTAISDDDTHAVQNADIPMSICDREINQKANLKEFNQKGISIYHSVEPAAELENILNNAQLHLIIDPQFRKTIESLITQMYYSSELKVDGSTIPQELIRSQLRRVDFCTIEFAQTRFVENAVDIRRGSKYLMACLYNAINDCDIDMTLDVRSFT